MIQRGSGEFQTISGTQTIIKSATGFALISELVFFPVPTASRII